MKSRISGKLVGVFVLLSSCAFSIVMDSPEAFFYNSGYKKGYEIGKKQGYVEGYRKAIEDVKNILEAYRVDIRSLEAGKFLYKKKLITYPRVFRLKDGDGYRIVVKGCRIEDIRSLDDIFTQEGLEIPILDLASVIEAKRSQSDILSFPQLSERVEEATKVPPKPIFIRVSPSATDLLERYNIPYIIEGVSGGEVVKAVFFSQSEVEEFCEKHKEVCSSGGETDELEEY